LVIHVVLFSFKPEADPVDIEKAKAAMAALPENVSAIGRYLGGPNTSPENLRQGYDWGFVITFADAAARDAYLSDPAHTAIHPLLDRVTNTVLVYDIEG
jgi:hypothetical protein